MGGVALWSLTQMGFDEGGLIGLELPVGSLNMAMQDELASRCIQIEAAESSTPGMRTMPG